MMSDTTPQPEDAHAQVDASGVPMSADAVPDLPEDELEVAAKAKAAEDEAAKLGDFA